MEAVEWVWILHGKPFPNRLWTLDEYWKEPLIKYHDVRFRQFLENTLALEKRHLHDEPSGTMLLWSNVWLMVQIFHCCAKASINHICTSLLFKKVQQIKADESKTFLDDLDCFRNEIRPFMRHQLHETTLNYIRQHFLQWKNIGISPTNEIYRLPWILQVTFSKLRAVAFEDNYIATDIISLQHNSSNPPINNQEQHEEHKLEENAAQENILNSVNEHKVVIKIEEDQSKNEIGDPLEESKIVALNHELNKVVIEIEEIEEIEEVKPKNEIVAPVEESKIVTLDNSNEPIQQKLNVVEKVDPKIRKALKQIRKKYRQKRVETLQLKYFFQWKTWIQERIRQQKELVKIQKQRKQEWDVALSSRRVCFLNKFVSIARQVLAQKRQEKVDILVARVVSNWKKRTKKSRRSRALAKFIQCCKKLLVVTPRTRRLFTKWRVRACQKQWVRQKSYLWWMSSCERIVREALFHIVPSGKCDVNERTLLSLHGNNFSKTIQHIVCTTAGQKNSVTGAVMTLADWPDFITHCIELQQQDFYPKYMKIHVFPKLFPELQSLSVIFDDITMLLEYIFEPPVLLQRFVPRSGIQVPNVVEQEVLKSIDAPNWVFNLNQGELHQVVRGWLTANNVAKLMFIPSERKCRTVYVPLQEQLNDTTAKKLMHQHFGVPDSSAPKLSTAVKRVTAEPNIVHDPNMLKHVQNIIKSTLDSGKQSKRKKHRNK